MADAPLSTAPVPACEGSSSTKGANCRMMPGEFAFDRFKELLLSEGPQIPTDQLQDFGWQIPLITSCDPSPFCITKEILSFEPQEDDIYKIFFRDTSKEVRIRQVFLHTALTAQEQQWLKEFRDYCTQENWPIPLFLEPMLLRIIWLAYRKWGDNIIARSFELAKSMVEWRQGFLPLSDKEEELKAMMETGVMYWSGRDRALRPLLIIRLSRLHKNASPEIFKRLTIFCFEWGLRYLMIPGHVETITALFDVRGVPLHQFPISALTDMTSTLTKQYPFRLNRMLIINDSFFVQTVWNIAKQFLTEVQQQKMLFMRSGFEEELLKEYTPWQLEKCYGGTRPEIRTFYPFPVAPGPYSIGSVQEEEPYKNAHRAVDRLTTFGVTWEGDCRMPVQWAPAAKEVFADLQLPCPQSFAGDAATDGDANAVADERCGERCGVYTTDSKSKTDAANEQVKEEPAVTATAEATAAAGADAVVADEIGRNAADEVETPKRELETAAEEAQECQKSEAQDPAAAAGGDTPRGGEDASVSSRVPDTNTEGREELVMEEANKLTAAAPATAEQAVAVPEGVALTEKEKEGRKLPPVEKVGSSKCCSRCKVQ
ncbi:CRAL/TRIO domain-containing protein, putative [Eimeria maxima]|uniref:CRAL/TRIO domain-containing protein, putative n=1 Tax=Eimeria maxima TaxID=5804 RepID=U6M235_EIMMA|nr:CRAL/TRIO domain-containing protein, putative [Eimeria maxima]CDJ58056.1 CRAL/TRIO domain-containing protein, putative [Eimeria maxima]